MYLEWKRDHEREDIPADVFAVQALAFVCGAVAACRAVMDGEDADDVQAQALAIMERVAPDDFREMWRESAERN